MGFENIVFPSDSLFLVTGGAGFIGSNLCTSIIELGYKVRCFDNLSNGFYKNIEHLVSNENFEFVEGTIENEKTCDMVCKDVDYVLHQAAWGSVPRSIKMPLYYENVNIKGTLNMLEASRNNNVKKFVFASSSSVYGDSALLPKVEGIEGNLLSPYALTKKVNEMYAKIYSDIYGLETIGLRYFNVFGRRQNPNGDYAAVIPKFINLLLKDQSPKINGDGEQSRDFTYIDNVIEANLKAAHSPSNVSGETFNIAYGGQITLNELFKVISGLLKKDNVKPIYGDTREGDIKHSNADIAKAERLLGYSPSYDFYRGIEEAIEWYKKSYESA